MNKRDDPRRDEEAPSQAPDADEPRDEPPVWDSDDSEDRGAEDAARRTGREGAPDEPPW